MNAVNVQSCKLTVVFSEGKLPAIDAKAPRFELVLGSLRIGVVINAKSARKLASHPGGAVLQGRLVASQAGLVLEQAGFSWTDAKPATEPTA